MVFLLAWVVAIGVERLRREADLLEVVEHAKLLVGTFGVYGLLGDATRGHLRLDVLETHLVVANVVGHVAVRVDGEQVGAVVDENLADLEIGARGGRVQRRPQIVVAYVHVGVVVDEQLEQIGAVVDTTLYENKRGKKIFKLFKIVYKIFKK